MTDLLKILVNTNKVVETWRMAILTFTKKAMSWSVVATYRHNKIKIGSPILIASLSILTASLAKIMLSLTQVKKAIKSLTSTTCNN